jgi:hypothetical protein
VVVIRPDAIGERDRVEAWVSFDVLRQVNDGRDGALELIRGLGRHELDRRDKLTLPEVPAQQVIV